MCKEDETYASKFFFSSPMSDKFAEDCLVMHESHAQPIVQEEAAMAVTFLGSGNPLLLLVGIANSADAHHISSSKLLDRDYGVLHSKGLDGAVVLAKGKEKVGVVL